MDIGLIVGSGMDSLADSAEWSEITTPYGPAFVAQSRIGGCETALLRRHGPMLNVPPHLIDYRANMWALRDMGVARVFATAAVGSLRRTLRPGTLAVIGDFIDFTKHREFTTFDSPGEAVVHLDFTAPYCPEISRALLNAAEQSGVEMVDEVVLVCVDGPRYETPAEVRMFARWGGDIVGMTGVPEVTLAREMGMCYGTLAMVTNYAAGISERPLSHQEVLAEVAKCRPQVQTVIEAAINSIANQPPWHRHGD